MLAKMNDDQSTTKSKSHNTRTHSVPSENKESYSKKAAENQESKCPASPHSSQYLPSSSVVPLKALKESHMTLSSPSSSPLPEREPHLPLLPLPRRDWSKPPNYKNSSPPLLSSQPSCTPLSKPRGNHAHPPVPVVPSVPFPVWVSLKCGNGVSRVR